MLDRAMEQTTELDANTTRRFSVPEIDITQDGSFTVFNNIKQIATYLNRDGREITRYIQDEIGTNANYTEDSVRLKGEFSQQDITMVINKYIESYVTCDQCNSPDTKYTEVSGVEMIKCTACGATNPKPN